jgi:glycosyltransferase involved in cell wall biosynthesis
MKLAMFVDTEWGLGNLHRGLAAHLSNVHGWDVVLFDWAKQHPRDTFSRFDRVLTLTGKPVFALVREYGISDKIICHVAHDEEDCIGIGARLSIGRRFAVVSDTMVASLSAMGFRDSIRVLPLGIDFAAFRRPIQFRLQTLGYLSVLQRTNAFGVERKRGHLLYEIAKRSGRTAVVPNMPRRVSQEDYPTLFDQFDALIFPSLTEGAGYPPLEAAAAGKLVLGTPAGMFPRLASEGIGLMGPSEADRFVDWAVNVLYMLDRDIEGYAKICQRSQAAASQYDWSKVGPIWKEFLES